MEKTVIPTKDKMREIVREAVRELFREELPVILRRAKRKEWITSKEAQEFLGVNARQLQYLRDQKNIPFSQDGRTIRYPTEGLERWLRENMVGRWREVMGDLDGVAPEQEPQ